MRTAWDAMQSRTIAEWEALGAEVRSLAEQGEKLVTPGLLIGMENFFDSIRSRLEDQCFVFECYALAYYTCDGQGCGQRICKSSDHSTKLEDGRRLCLECMGE